MVGHCHLLVIESTPILIATEQQHAIYGSWCADRKAGEQSKLSKVLSISVARDRREIDLTAQQCRIQARRYTQHEIDIILFILFVQQSVIDWLDVQVGEDTEGNWGGKCGSGSPCACQALTHRVHMLIHHTPPTTTRAQRYTGCHARRVCARPL